MSPLRSPFLGVHWLDFYDKERFDLTAQPHNFTAASILCEQGDSYFHIVLLLLAFCVNKVIHYFNIVLMLLAFCVNKVIHTFTLSYCDCVNKVIHYFNIVLLLLTFCVNKMIHTFT